MRAERTFPPTRSPADGRAGTCPTPGAAFDAARFEAFAAEFRPVFPRADQFRRFRAYLRGLLAPGERKNVAAIAAGAVGAVPAAENLTQALQHFVTRSPWDAGRLLAAYRRSLVGMLADPHAVWVVHDAVFPKRGRHSVGVQRQFARSLGRKVNCQIGVVLSQLGPNGYFPLAARLYLPGSWLRGDVGGREGAVPEGYRRPASKGEIALALIDEVRAEGRTPGRAEVIAEGGYATAHELTDGLTGRGLRLPSGRGPESTAVLGEVHRRFDRLRSRLGLDHFEGRTWVGWHHHVSLVFTAHALTVMEQSGGFHTPSPA